MADVEVSYKGSTIGSLNDTGSLTLETAGTYVEDDITVGYTKSGGGGGGVERKAVNFFDCDGTVLYSYTAQEAAALEALPANPTHTGLTAQGWNYTLAEMKTQVAAMGACDVGQMYVTSDGKTRLYVHFERGRTSPYLGLGVNGTVTVDWGDDSATDTLTGTSLTTAQNVQHVYAAPGDYVITLTLTAGTVFNIFGTSSGTHLLKRGTSIDSSGRGYSYALRRVEIGTGVRIGDYAFQYCGGLTSITIPNSVTSFGGAAFNRCYSLSQITIPNSVSSISQQGFYYCYNLMYIAIPSSVTSIVQQGFGYSDGRTFLVIPASVTSIGANAFNGCYGMGEYHFLPTTPPTLANTNAFSNNPSDFVIYVPRSTNQTVLNAYKTASNWSTYASYMQEEPA